MMNAIGRVARVFEIAATPDVRELVIIDRRQMTDVVNKSVNAVSDDSISKQVVQAVERTHVDFFVWQIKFSKRLRYF